MEQEWHSCSHWVNLTRSTGQQLRNFYTSHYTSFLLFLLHYYEQLLYAIFIRLVMESPSEDNVEGQNAKKYETSRRIPCAYVYVQCIIYIFSMSKTVFQNMKFFCVPVVAFLAGFCQVDEVSCHFVVTIQGHSAFVGHTCIKWIADSFFAIRNLPIEAIFIPIAFWFF